MKFFALVLGIIGWSGSLARAGELTDPTAILAKCEAAYTHCETCTVEGHLFEEMHALPPQANTKDMRLWFARSGNLFRLDWTEAEDKGDERRTNSVFTRDGETYFFWGSLNRFERQENRRMTLVVATGISSGLAYLLPGMLVGRGGTVNLKDPVLKPVATLDGRDCYVVAGTSRFGDNPMELAVDKESFAVARVKEHRHSPSNSSADIAEHLGKSDPKLAAEVAARPPTPDFDTDRITTYKTTFGAAVSAADCDYPVPAGMTLSEETR